MILYFIIFYFVFILFIVTYDVKTNVSCTCKTSDFQISDLFSKSNHKDCILCAYVSSIISAIKRMLNAIPMISDYLRENY